MKPVFKSLLFVLGFTLFASTSADLFAQVDQKSPARESVSDIPALTAPPALADPVSFEREVMPLLEKRCNKCHYPEEQRGGLDLTRLTTIRRGGDELGPAIVAGKPDDSPLIQVLTSVKKPKMPDQSDPLPASEIDLLRRWIAEGAVDDTQTFPSEDLLFYEREIRPVLATRCFKCHAGDEPEHGLRLTSRQGVLSGGLRGPAAIAGKPQESLLMKAIRHDGDLRMPRGGDKLTEAQVAAFEKWIAKELPWPSHETVLARTKQFTISDADRNHWAFRPLPKDPPADWSIDAALNQHHQRLGMTPSRKADYYRLLRRVTYDLIGYPPTPQEMEAFIRECSEDDETLRPEAKSYAKAQKAYERVVDRLLNSPQFGQRWGRHWLDYTRNGANAQSNRGPALDASRYAAWVAKCFNEDRPWDWFARVHLAGDKMPAFEGNDYSVDQALAAAVPLNGPRTFEEVGSETFVLMDKLDEGIEFMGRSLMGISLECARCHDHKFDPISQRDYYALLGYFQSSWYAPVPRAAKTRNEAEAAINQYRELIAERARALGLIRQKSIVLNVSGNKGGGGKAGGGGKLKQWQESRTSILAPTDKRLRELELLVLRAELASVEKKNDERLANDIRSVVAERETKLKDYQPPKFSLAIFGPAFHNFLKGHKTQRGLIERAATLGLTSVVTELESQQRYWREEHDQWIERSRFGGYAKSDPEVIELAKADERVNQINAELRVNAQQPWVVPEATHLYVRCDGGLRRVEDLKPFDEAAKAAGLTFNSNNPDRVWMHPFFIGDARLLQRGDVLFPQDLIPRATPQFFGASTSDLQGSGRLQLAEWLTAKDSIQSALVARAVVNRTWQHLFGEGLCRTPKELGRLGETPELPEIVDSLSTRFIGNGWSMKSLIREIVLSDAYRRGTIDFIPEKDSDNRFFTHQNVRRLEYEAILNTMAWLRTGKRQESSEAVHSMVPAAADYAKQFDGPSVYDVIDRRVASISATQALFLMNNPVAARGIAGDLHNRLHIDSKTSLIEAIDMIYTVVLQRPPTDAERGDAQGFLEHRRRQTGETQLRNEVHEFISLLLCGNEVIYLE
jgi:hypothetical protein